jgi:hypothetical protein
MASEVNYTVASGQPQYHAPLCRNVTKPSSALCVFDRGPADASTPARICCRVPNVNYGDRASREQITQKLCRIFEAVRGIKRRTHILY